MIVIYCAIVLGILFIFWTLLLYHRFSKERDKTEKNFLIMDDFMKKRHKDIGDIVGISGEYIGKENMLLKNLLGAYNKVYYARNFSEKVEGENLIDIALNDYFEKISSQIELTENSTWKDIKSNIFETEIKIAEAIIEYNHSVRDYNTMIELFPNHIIAKMFMFDKKPIFANKKDFQKIIGH